MNKLLEIYFEWQSDTLVQQILLIALVLKPIVHHPTRLLGEPLCFISWKCHQDCWLSFWNIKASCSFPVLWICSLLLFASSKWNSCFRALSGKSNKIDMEILLSVGWIYNNTTFLKFQNSRIFPETSYISGQMEYSFDSWIFV